MPSSRRGATGAETRPKRERSLGCDGRYIFAGRSPARATVTGPELTPAAASERRPLHGRGEAGGILEAGREQIIPGIR